MKTAVQFGAGSIGRGFMGQLFTESGYEVVFVDVVPEVVSELNRRRSYPLHIVGEGAQELTVRNVRAVDGRDAEAVASEVAAASLICTAVGASALPAVAKPLARGLARRTEPVNIIVCENMPHPAETLRELLLSDASPELAAFIRDRVGLSEAVVARMVPVQRPTPGADPLLVVVEAYKRLPVDARGFVGEVPRVVGMEPTDNIRAYADRKLFSHNAVHAVAAYLGHLRGYQYIYQVMADDALSTAVREAAWETGEALIRKHGFTREEHAAYLDDLLRRIGSVPLGDTVARVGRDPVRKLAREDRLVGGALLAMEYDIRAARLAQAIAAALLFDEPGDPSAGELQRMLAAEGVDAVLRKVCGLEPDHPLATMVKQEYQKLR